MKLVLCALLVFHCFSAAASDSHCSQQIPTLCVQLENPNGSNTQVLGSFTLRFNSPVEIRDLDLMWENVNEEFAVVTVPMKITKIDEMSFKVEGVLTMIEGLWTVRVTTSPEAKIYITIRVSDL